MLEVKISSARRFYYLSPAGDAALTPTLTVYDTADAVVKTETGTNDIHADLPAVYQTDELTFTTKGQYRYTWTVAAAVVETGSFLVIDAPLGDASITVPQHYYFAAPALLTGVTDVVPTIYDKDGKEIYNKPVVISTSAFASGDAFSTITTATDHGLSTGNKITIVGHTVAALNAIHTVTVLTTKTFTVPTPGDVAGGTKGTHQLVAIENATTAGVYATSATVSIDVEGVYLLEWSSVSKAATWTKIVTLLLLPSPELRTLTVYAIDNSVTPNVAHADLETVLSTTVGAPLEYAKTDSDGKVQFRATNGSYVVSFRKTGVVFDKNNLAVTVVDNKSVHNANVAYLLTGYLSPTFAGEDVFTSADRSLMKVNLADLLGEPIVGASILITNHHVPSSKTGASTKKAIVLGPPIRIVTDGDGHAEISLLRGIDVTVAFEGSGVRRDLTVPSQASFDLTDELSQNDPFDIVVPKIAAAVRRST